MAEEKLLTVEQFNVLTYKWAQRIRQLAKSSLANNTSSSGTLSKFLTAFVDQNDKTKAAYKVKFHFERYGVYRAYGVGRGYVRVNGAVMRGNRVTAAGTGLVQKYLKDGYRMSEVRRMKLYRENSQNTVTRTPLDWIDQYIDGSINELADVVQEYYGDKSLRDLLLDFQNIKIVKNG